jgi:hypothetical protein
MSERANSWFFYFLAALAAGLPIALFAIAMRGLKFPSAIAADWADAGDWLAGSASISIGLLSLYLIRTTVRQNSDAIAKANESLATSEQTHQQTTQVLNEMLSAQRTVGERQLEAVRAFQEASTQMVKMIHAMVDRLEIEARTAKISQLQAVISIDDQELDRLLSSEFLVDVSVSGFQGKRSATIRELLFKYEEGAIFTHHMKGLEKKQPNLISAIKHSLARRKLNAERLCELDQSHGESAMQSRKMEETALEIE